jgi:predicted nucleic acid-binding protein
MTVAHCLDTNVLVYAFSNAGRDAAKARIAREWIDREDWGVTAQVLQEFHVNAIRVPHQLGHDEAVAMIEEIASSRPVIGADLALVRLALQIKRRYGIGYWDAAVVAGARRMGAAVLVSEDFSHGQDYGGVRVLNPFAAI